MKIKIMAAAATVAAALASCELDVSDNGKLDGYWQMEALDSLHNGKSVDMRDSMVFMAVQFDMLSFRKIDGDEVFFDFENTGDSLFLSNPFINDRDAGDIAVDDVDLLRPYGINSLDEHFGIELLKSGKTILKSGELRLHFRKY